MVGEPIAQVEEGMRTIIQELRTDPYALETVFVGILAFAKFLHWLLRDYEKGTMLVLVGFVIGSLVKVWPWNDMEAVAKADFIQGGASAEQAEIAAGNLAQLVAGGQSWSNFGVERHLLGACIWAAVGIFVVWALETLSSGKAK
jgi:putative membrane protein